MIRTVFVRSISALTVSGFVLAAQPLMADAGEGTVLASLFKASAFAKDGDSDSSGSGSGGSDSSGSGSGGSDSSGSGSGGSDSSGSDGSGDGDGDSSGSDGPGDGDGDSSGRDGPGDNDGDNSGPGGGDHADDDDDHDDDGGRGRGRGRGRGDDDRHHAGHHSQPRNLMDFFTGNRDRGAVVKAEIEGTAVEVTYTDGWKEEIEHGRYELKDPSNRTVVERPATQDDVDRLNSAF